MEKILIPVLIFSALGVLFGIILAIAARVFAVKTDERIPQVQEHLPGANCGGCGFTGCAALAEAIVKGAASPSACNSCSDAGRQAIGAIMGIAVADKVPMQAQVLCSGACGKAKLQYRYEGTKSCIAADKMGGGDKLCAFGCIGLGTCVEACQFDALHIVNGVAMVDHTKCGGCGACASVCPKKLITLLPVQSEYFVACSSKEKGAVTRRECDAGCIGCGICAKLCPEGAITVTDFVAHIDQSKCKRCGICAAKCPRKVIRHENEILETIVNSEKKA